ncbi:MULTISPECIES: nuclear transport factor 2 family protein [Novosphingobium]|jgi:ketosteroid isomerase-like protein|uniref:SnoaL-like domain-containing protein n=2 Tax=Novosphingobium TaxID=165696 RepID=G6EJB7_9SPHN|nr:MULTISPECIES: nuclear transport factor 2 family protein [Novosphingobium]EHJ58603.1 hypothetical protein NSU_4438 [Novosphingobium pentaromativorans US6-1]MDE8651862.1 nuclear transport factor 2 family protein [Novosphingobium album (ex Liu et al. 2023)]
MDAEDIVTNPVIRAELEALIAEHAYRVDFCCSENLAELYTEDGRFVLPSGTEYVGREGVNAYGRLSAGKSDRRVRHVFTNFRFVMDGPDQILGVSFVTLYRTQHRDTAPPEAVALADAKDIYRRCPDGRWRIYERRIEVVFETDEHRQG